MVRYFVNLVIGSCADHNHQHFCFRSDNLVNNTNAGTREFYFQESRKVMLGDRLLAAPVLTPGVTARAVYLPKGVWFDYYTGKRYVGGKYILADAPADRMPLFAKAGAAIPVSMGKPQFVEEIRKVVLEVFPGNGRCVHHMDDGETMDYLNGGIRRIQITVRGHRVVQKIIADGYPGPDSLSVHWMA